MTLITIAPGVRVLRRHPDRDVLIVEGLGEYATLFIESIPGGWCVVNGEAATKRIYEQVRQCEEGGMDEKRFDEIKARLYAATPGKWSVTRGVVAGLQVSADSRGVCCMYSDATESNATFIAHARQDVPDLLLEVRRLQADNRRLSDNLKHVSTALGKHLRQGQTPEGAIMRIVGDLAACERERDAYRRERDELRLALLAEQGDIKGAPDGWKRTGSMWFRPLGPVNHQVEVRRGTIHPTGEPYHWTLYTPTLSAEGYAPYAREAMKRADKAFQEKA